MSATEFKTKCLSLLDQLQSQGGAVTITKRGRPVASFGAAEKRRYPSPEGSWTTLFPDLPDMEPSDYDMPWKSVARSDRFDR